MPRWSWPVPSWVIANSHFLNLDTGLLFFLTLTLCAFLQAQQDEASPRERRYGMWIAWAAMAGATLSERPDRPGHPRWRAGPFTLINWQWVIWRRMQWLPGMALYLALTVPWFWLVSKRKPGLPILFIHEHFERFLTNVHRREEPVWFFVPILFAGFLPWTSLLPRVFLAQAGPGAQGRYFRRSASY